MPNLPIISETIPEGSCPATYNELAQLFASHFFAVQNFGVGKQWIFSAAKPTLEQTDYGWFQLDDQGLPVRPYLFAQGLWLSRHPMQTGQTIWVFNAVADILTYDGGDGTAIVSPTTGPMWQYARTGNFNNIDDGTIIAAKFPIVQGTLPSTTVLAVGDEGGEEKHSLTIAEMPPHSHDIDFIEFSDGPQAGKDRGLRKSTDTDPSDGTIPTSSVGGAGDPPVVTPITNMPPYIVGILLQRTARTHYAITA